MIRSMDAADAVAVRGNQDDKALAAYVQWKAGEPLVSMLPPPISPSHADWIVSA